LFKYPIKLRNQVADSFFYDVGALDPAEKDMLSPLVDLKGSIIVVSPRNAARKDKIRHYKSALMFNLQEGASIQAIAVAGVGSSVLGTAALARNVADYTGWDVAGIVTGYGLSDVVVEGLGGWFYYGGIDRFRYKMEQDVDRLLTPKAPATRPEAGDRPLLSPEARATRPEAEFFEPGYPLGSFDALGDSDVRTLHDILLVGPPKLRLLVGHSKGNLLISFALNHMKGELGDMANMANKLREARNPLFNHLTVVTLGAVVDIPTDPFDLKTHQFLGQLDMLGQINSDRFPPFFGTIALEHEVIPGVGHHLNPNIPYFMPVADVLAKAGVPRAEDVPRRGDGGDGHSLLPPDRSTTPWAISS
jgi:hypothetical protein